MNERPGHPEWGGRTATARRDVCPLAPCLPQQRAAGLIRNPVKAIALGASSIPYGGHTTIQPDSVSLSGHAAARGAYTRERVPGFAPTAGATSPPVA